MPNVLHFSLKVSSYLHSPCDIFANLSSRGNPGFTLFKTTNPGLKKRTLIGIAVKERIIWISNLKNFEIRSITTFFINGRGIVGVVANYCKQNGEITGLCRYCVLVVTVLVLEGIICLSDVL